MKSIQHQELWDRIRTFSIDDPQATIRFSDKLSSQQGWTTAYTTRVIEEYKRFMFLCCISPTGASPSPDVDEVWHLHLTYTANYWKEFCRDTLQKEIHHHPSKGGTSEKHRHDDWYAATLAFYREVFNEDPPVDIWPPAGKRETDLSALADHHAGYSQNKYKPLLLLAAPFIVPFFYGAVHPFDLTGPQFLVFYIALGIVSFVVLFVLARLDRVRIRAIVGDRYRNDADAYQVSRFVFGRYRSVQTAIIDLVEKRVLVAEQKGKFVFHPGMYKPGSGGNNPLINDLVKYYQEGEVLTYDAVAACYNDDITFHPELSNIYKSASQKHPWRYVVGISVLLLGIARCLQGAVNDRPYGYLVMTMISMLVIYVILYSSLNGTTALQSVIRKGYRNHLLGSQFNVSSPVNQYAFLGLVTLGAGYYVFNIESTFARNSSQGDAGSFASGSSCGSSCGGGGGGCGGCGGS